MMYLKADTAVEVPVGPAVAVGDGFTPVTNLSIAGADEAELLKYNGNTAITTTAIAGSLAAITGADGYYTLDLSASNTDTEGFMILLINDDSLILPIRLEFQVVAANIYDSMFAVAGTDVLDINVKEISGNSTAADNAQADYDGTGYNKSNSTIGTASVLTGHTVQTANHTSNIAAILADTAEIGTAGVGLHDLGGMSDAMKAEVNAQADTAIGDASLATAAALATVDGIVDDILVDTSTTLDTKINTIDGIVDDILIDTGTTLDGKINTIDGIVDDILVDTGTTLDTKINTIDGIVDDILVDTAVIGAGGAGLTALATAANLATVDTVVDSILADTGTDGVVVASIGDGAIGAAAVADIFSTTAIAESYGTDGSTLTVAQALYLIVSHMGEHAITSTTKTLKKLDGSTTAGTFTLDDATSPTSITRAT